MKSAASNQWSFKKQPSKKQIYKIIFFFHSIKMENLILDELKTIAEMRDIRGYESMSKKRLIRSEKIRKDCNELRDF